MARDVSLPGTDFSFSTEAFAVTDVAFTTSVGATSLREVVEAAGGRDVKLFFYKPVKKENVSAAKRVVLRGQDGSAYEMDATQLPKLFPEVKIPGQLLSVPSYDLFVQSTSPNRKLAAGQEACFHGVAKGGGGGGGKRGRDEGDLRSQLKVFWDDLPPEERGQEYFAKYNGAPPLPQAAELLKMLEAYNSEKRRHDRGGSYLGMRPILHVPVENIDMWDGEEDEEGRRWPYHNRADDFDAANLGKTKYGGVPHLPEALSHYGRREDFVAQIDCSYMAAYDVRGVLPISGWIWLWHQFQYIDEHACVVRYWNGPREELKPRTQCETKAKPVYFVTGFALPRSLRDADLNLGPVFFACDFIDDVEEWVPQSFPQLDACITLLCIRNFRDSVFSKLPRDIVRMIAKKVLEIAEWKPYDRNSWCDARGECPPLWPFYDMGPDDCCGYMPDSCWYGSPVIPYADALAGRWHKSQAVGNTD